MKLYNTYVWSWQSTCRHIQIPRMFLLHVPKYSYYLKKNYIHSKLQACEQNYMCAIHVCMGHTMQSKDKPVDINLHVTGIYTGIHTSYVIWYAMNSLLTWMSTLVHCTCTQFLFTCQALTVLLKTFNVSYTNTPSSTMPNKVWNHKI